MVRTRVRTGAMVRTQYVQNRGHDEKTYTLCYYRIYLSTINIHKIVSPFYRKRLSSALQVPVKPAWGNKPLSPDCHTCSRLGDRRDLRPSPLPPPPLPHPLSCLLVHYHGNVVVKHPRSISVKKSGGFQLHEVLCVGAVWPLSRSVSQRQPPHTNNTDSHGGVPHHLGLLRALHAGEHRIAVPDRRRRGCRVLAHAQPHRRVSRPRRSAVGLQQPHAVQPDLRAWAAARQRSRDHRPPQDRPEHASAERQRCGRAGSRSAPELVLMRESK
jgi:hypothetical protein